MGLLDTMRSGERNQKQFFSKPLPPNNKQCVHGSNNVWKFIRPRKQNCFNTGKKFKKCHGYKGFFLFFAGIFTGQMITNLLNSGIYCMLSLTAGLSLNLTTTPDQLFMATLWKIGAGMYGFCLILFLGTNCC